MSLVRTRFLEFGSVSPARLARWAGLLLAMGMSQAGGAFAQSGGLIDRARSVPPSEVAPLPAPAEVRASSRTRFLGSASCAASNCHGNPDESRRTGAEYGYWLQRDPHARAHSTLYSDRSQAIAGKLGVGPAQRAAQCVACHAIDGPADIDLAHDALRSQGVGCEACHGPAERWIEPHKRPDWKRPDLWPDAAKAALGFRPTKELVGRAETCAGCHVGEAGRDVNHDLIAAGHPRLSFELAAYHSRLPKHWNHWDDVRRHSSALEARLWLVGQATSLDASLGLLEARARNEDAPWPEFSEYACASCHHRLDVGRTLALPEATTRIGFQWNSWYGAHGATVGEYAGTPERHRQVNDALEKLRRTMQHPGVTRDAVRNDVPALRAFLSEWKRDAAARPFDTETLRGMTLRVATTGDELIERDWDSATQWFLGLAALQFAQAELEGRYGSPRTPRDLARAAAMGSFRRRLARTDDGSPARHLGTPEFRGLLAPELRGHGLTIRSLLD